MPNTLTSHRTGPDGPTCDKQSKSVVLCVFLQKEWSSSSRRGVWDRRWEGQWRARFCFSHERKPPQLAGGPNDERCIRFVRLPTDTRFVNTKQTGRRMLYNTKETQKRLYIRKTKFDYITRVSA